MPDWLRIALQTLASVVTLFLMSKILGKRQISHLSFFEYITGITIGNLAAYMSLEEDWFLGLTAIFVWIVVYFCIEFMQLKSKRFRNWMDSTPTVLIKDGKILEENLKKERVTTDELLQQLRKKSVFKAADVEFAVMEANGDINVLVQKKHRPLTPASLGIQVGPEQEPQAVIMDGKILEEPLATLGLNRRWLLSELEKFGVTLENVFLGQVDTYGQLYVDLFDDQINVPAPQRKAALLAELKKCAADIEKFGLWTNDREAKRMYESCYSTIEHVIEEVTPYLHR